MWDLAERRVAGHSTIQTLPQPDFAGYKYLYVLYGSTVSKWLTYAVSGHEINLQTVWIHSSLATMPVRICANCMKEPRRAPRACARRCTASNNRDARAYTSRLSCTVHVRYSNGARTVLYTHARYSNRMRAVLYTHARGYLCGCRSVLLAVLHGAR